MQHESLHVQVTEPKVSFLDDATASESEGTKGAPSLCREPNAVVVLPTRQRQQEVQEHQSQGEVERKEHPEPAPASTESPQSRKQSSPAANLRDTVVLF